MARNKNDGLGRIGGRGKNVPNKTSNEIRQMFQMLVENNIDNLQTDLESMEPEKRVNYILKLSEFILPKLQSLSIDNQLEIEYKHLESLLSKGDDASLEIISNKILSLKNNYNEKND